MGIFHEMAEVINRTSKRLNCRFDGQDIKLLPNYTPEGEFLPEVHNIIPAQTVAYAKSQNVLMGSEDPTDPSEYQVLVGVKAKAGDKQKDDISFLEQSEALTRVDLEAYLDDPTLKIMVAGRQTKTRRADATSPMGTTPFEVRPR